MKWLVLIATMSIASAQAADYKCRSQRNGLRFSISESKKRIIVTNRAGQTYQKYEDLRTSKYTVETNPVSHVTMFISGKTPVLEVSEYGNSKEVYAVYDNDFDIICVKSKE